MKNEEVKNIFISFIVIFFFCLFVGAATILYTTSRQSNELRRQLDSVRTELSRSADTNRELAEELEQCRSRLEQCNFIAEELAESAGRNISTIRECVELVEEVRYQTACLLYYASSYSSDELYAWCDSIIYDNEVSNETRD